MEYDAGPEDVATGALPPAMLPTTFEEDGGLSDGQLVDTGVNVAEETLTDGLKPTLQSFCDRTSNAADKARALELLTALELSENIRAEAGGCARAATSSACSQASLRPRTAMPRLQSRERRRTPLSYVNSYETTHGYYYQPPQPVPTAAVRPASSQMQRVVPPPDELAPCNSFNDLYMQTTYGREFLRKSDGRCEPERAASARGVRNHNPQPNQEFMVWRYRRPMTATDRIELVAAGSSGSSQRSEEEPASEELTNEAFDRAIRGKCRSTYKTDFLGVQQTFDASRLGGAQVAATRPKFDKSSTSRGAFGRPPPVPAELATSVGRYPRERPQAQGVLPAGGLSRHRFGTRARTTYDLHISGPANRLLQVGDLRSISNAQNAQAVAKLLEGATGSERISLMKLYKEMESRRIPVSVPAPVERRARQQLMGARRQGAQLAGTSTWAGP